MSEPIDLAAKLNEIPRLDSIATSHVKVVDLSQIRGVFTAQLIKNAGPKDPYGLLLDTDCVKDYPLPDDAQVMPYERFAASVANLIYQRVPIDMPDQGLRFYPEGYIKIIAQPENKVFPSVEKSANSRVLEITFEFGGASYGDTPFADDPEFMALLAGAKKMIVQFEGVSRLNDPEIMELLGTVKRVNGATVEARVIDAPDPADGKMN